MICAKEKLGFRDRILWYIFYTVKAYADWYSSKDALRIFIVYARVGYNT